jgi:hypothetical protein
MKRVHLFSLAVCLGMTASAVAGDLWINCAPRSEIFVDGESVGVCESAEAGLRLPGIEAGEHTVRVEADGFMPAEVVLSLGPASTQVVIPDLVPVAEGDPPESEGGSEPAPLSGTVEVTSNPRKCTVEFAGRKIDKNQPIMIFLGIPAGEYDFHVDSSGNALTSVVTVQAGQTVKAMVDFSNERVAISAVESGGGELESTTGEEVPRGQAECIEWWIQVLRTDDLETIKAASSALKEMGFPGYHQKFIHGEDDGAIPVYKLRVGPIPRENQARHIIGRIRMAGFKSAWLVPAECESSP